jgi:hypothetical protein
MTLLAETAEEVKLFEPGIIPPEAAMVASSLEAGRHSLRERRVARRYPYRVATRLRLFSDSPAAAPRVLYTRDINRRSLAFITSHRLPLGYGGIIELPNDDGHVIDVNCTLLRCREASPGWYEGSVYFNREQPQFDQG